MPETVYETEYKTEVDYKTAYETEYKTEIDYKTAYETEYKTKTDHKTEYKTEYETEYKTEYKTKTAYEPNTSCPPNYNTDCSKCPSKGVLRNGDFSSALADSNWIPLRALTSGDATISIVSGALSARLNGQQSNNLSQRIVQSVVVCPGSKYTISFQAKRATTSGSVGASAYIGNILVGGGTITSTSFTTAPNNESGSYTVPAGVNSVIVRFEFTYSDSNSAAREVQIDNVALVQVS